MREAVLLDPPDHRVAPVTRGHQSSLAHRATLLAPDGVPTLVVAPHDAPDIVKSCADYVCTGVDDHLTVQAAIDALPEPTESHPVGPDDPPPEAMRHQLEAAKALGVR